MASHLYPAKGVHVASVDDDLVVLDTKADTYICIPQGVALLGFDVATNSFKSCDDAAAKVVLDAGLAVREGPVEASSRPSLPVRSLAFQGPRRPRLSDLPNLAGCTWDLAWRYAGRRFPDILDYIARQRLRRRPCHDDLPRLVQVFHSAAIWLPDSRKCLVRSFLLLRFLQRSGCDAQWVFGVRTWPFAAHCWLQVGDAVLDDAAEQLVKYRPIRTA
jgi:hypothetical protein